MLISSCLIYTDIGTYESEDPSESKQRESMTDEKNWRKFKDAKLMAQLENAIREMLNPANKYAKNMAKMQKAFNRLNPAKTIHTELKSLAHNAELPDEQNGSEAPNRHL
jgi:hypothetical protein